MTTEPEPRLEVGQLDMGVMYWLPSRWHPIARRRARKTIAGTIGRFREAMTSTAPLIIPWRNPNDLVGDLRIMAGRYREEAAVWQGSETYHLPRWAKDFIAPAVVARHWPGAAVVIGTRTYQSTELRGAAAWSDLDG